MYAIRSYYEWFGERAGFTAFHWHGETFSLPPGATRILENAHCENQAYVLGKHLGLQCHVITSYSIHYTKLYDTASRRARAGSARGGSRIRARLRPAGGPREPASEREWYRTWLLLAAPRVRNGARRRQAADACGHSTARAARRITSYNVCYTKLLRERRPRLLQRLVGQPIKLGRPSHYHAGDSELSPFL